MTFCIGHYRPWRKPAASASAILSNSGVMNPATLSTRLGTLFPPGAVAADLRGPGDPKLLLPAEAKYMGRAVPKRVQEFAAGRLCARRALAGFGIVVFPFGAAAAPPPGWAASQ